MCECYISIMTAEASSKFCSRYVRPYSCKEIVKIVCQASENALTVTYFGGSFPVITSDADVLVNLGRLDRVVCFDVDEKTITVEAGMTLKELYKVLEHTTCTLELYGVLPNMSVADAIAVGLTGSSGSVARCLVSCEVVVPSGEVLSRSWPGTDLVEGHVCDRKGDSSLRELVCGLGCLGVVTTATFQCRTMHFVEEYSYQCTMNELVEKISELSNALYANLYWFPLLDKVVVVYSNLVRLKLAYQQPYWKKFLELLNWGYFYVINRLSPMISWYMPSLACYLSQKQLDVLRSICYYRRNCCFRPYSFMVPTRYCSGVRWVLPTSNLNAAVLDLEDWAERHPHLSSTPVLLSLQSDAQPPARSPLLAPHLSRTSCAVWADWFDSRSITSSFSAAMAEFESLLQGNAGLKCWSAGPVYASPFIGQTYPGYAAWVRARQAVDPGKMLRSAYVAGELLPQLC